MRKEILRKIEQYIKEFQSEETNRKMIPQGKFLKLASSKHTFQNGKTITREEIVKNEQNGSAVIILAITANPIVWKRNLVLIVEPRVFTKRKVGIGLPAGYIEPGETPEQAAYRELLEETGYQAQNLKTILSFYQDEGCSRAFNHVVLATGCKKVGEQHLDPDEQIEFLECKYQEALELIDKGYIQGSNSIIGLNYGKTYRKRR